MNIEFMMAPTRSQLLYNKHKGLSGKCQQEKSYLDREKHAFLKSYQTDRRMMERRKERYAKSRHNIVMRRRSTDIRSRTPDSDNLGRNSAPPVMEGKSLEDQRPFVTHETTRGAKSAEVMRYPRPYVHANGPSMTAILSPRSQFRVPSVSQSNSTPTQAPRRHPPFLSRETRQKSVRFQNNTDDDQTDTNETLQQRIDTPIEDRIKQFIESQETFNKRTVDPRHLRGIPSPGSSITSSVAKRYTGLKLKMTDLEMAFDNFCGNTSDDGFHKLVRYASKMKANVKIARNTSLVPTMASLRGSKTFKGVEIPKAWAVSH